LKRAEAGALAITEGPPFFLSRRLRSALHCDLLGPVQPADRRDLSHNVGTQNQSALDIPNERLVNTDFHGAFDVQVRGRVSLLSEDKQREHNR